MHVAGATLAGVTNVADASSVLSKSGPTDIDGPSALTVMPFTGSTTNGSITLNADGTFTYVPNVGFTGVDSIPFQVTDSVTPVAGTINITVSERVWYVRDVVDANNAAGGDGRSTNAFETLAAAAAASLPNDIIFVFYGNTGTTALTDSVALKNGQRLWGEGIGLTVGSFGTLVPAGSRPRVSTTNATVTVLSNAGNGDRTGVEIRGLDLTSTTNNAIVATSADAADLGLRIGDNTIAALSGGREGVNLNQGSTGAATVALHDNTIGATGTGLDISRGNGTLTITRFDHNTIAGNTGGTGIMINGPVTFDSTPGGALDEVSGGITTIGASGNAVSGSGIVVTSATGHLSFVDLDVFTNNGAGISVQGTGTFTGVSGMRFVANTDVKTITAAGGPAVAFATLTTDFQNAVLTSTNSASTGVSLVDVVGTFTVGGGAINNAASADFSIAGGTANVTYGGTITDDAGVLVSVSGATAGTKSFTGSITDGNDGDGSGISLTGNTGATIAFSGGLTLSTGSNPAFTATGGGIVNVCDEHPCNPGATGSAINRITTTTGTALNVANTTIGASNLEFRSISANGAANGIVLNNTGSSGGLRVKGDGSANSGGTIQNTSGDGISATNTQGLSLTSMLISNTDGNGINASDLRGTNALTNSTITAFGSGTNIMDGLHVVNDVANLTSLTVSGSTFSNAPGGNGGVYMEARGTSNMSLTVTGSTFTGIVGDGVKVITVIGASGTVNVSILNSNFVNAGVSQNGGIRLDPFGGPVVFNATITGNLLDNILKPTGLAGHIDLSVGDLDGSGPTSTFNISNNTIRNNSTDHPGIRFIADTFAGTTKVRIENNDIDNFNFGAISVAGYDSASDLDVVVHNNRIGQLTGSIGNVCAGLDEAVHISGQDSAVVDVLFTNNIITSNGCLETVRFRAVGDAVVNATVNDNTITDNGGALEVELAFSTPTGDGGTVNASATGNQLGSGGILELSEGTAGTVRVTQASAAALASGNNGATVTQTWYPGVWPAAANPSDRAVTSRRGRSGSSGRVAVSSPD